MKTLKKFFAVLMAAFFLLSAWTCPVMANEMETSTPAPEAINLTELYINPLYEEVIDGSDLNIPSENSISVYEATEYYNSVSEAGADFRIQMKQRLETIEVGLLTDDAEDDTLKSLSRSIASKALIHTGDPTEGDYLLWQYGGWHCKITGYLENDLYCITFTYTMTYYTTAEQEEELNVVLADVMNELDLDNKTDYEKIKSIYTYICDNVTYDNKNLNDDNYTLKYTAYAALINKTAVCQGYAVLLYRMTLETGIDARFIAGEGNGNSHGWNIARMDNYYYNLDATWDAGETTYDYFLRCEDNFPGHIRYDDYTTEEFNSSYPMGTEDYQPSEDNPPTENPFTDVSENDYYYDAVIWAYKNDIVNGKDENHFCPSDPCTRAQSAAFLWRANNEPEPVTTENPFKDVNPSDYYYKAVLWAYENGITKGKDETHFQPNGTVTRREFITFLWRSAGEPEPEMTENPFVDVPDDQYYTKAVLWAYENGITKGKDETHFQPERQCIRAQVVSFLYRFFN
ncbi:MAG: S-layer homology domain-containing protein [Lachnospiraceae bacterium]